MADAARVDGKKVVRVAGSAKAGDAQRTHGSADDMADGGAYSQSDGRRGGGGAQLGQEERLPPACRLDMWNVNIHTPHPIGKRRATISNGCQIQLGSHSCQAWHSWQRSARGGGVGFIVAVPWG